MKLSAFPATAIAVVALPFVALAAGQDGCALSYETYEISVPHTDLETCPASMEIENAYCRVSVVAEVATIFAFSEESDCIVASRAYFEDEFELTLN